MTYIKTKVSPIIEGNIVFDGSCDSRQCSTQ